LRLRNVHPGEAIAVTTVPDILFRPKGYPSIISALDLLVVLHLDNIVERKSTSSNFRNPSKLKRKRLDLPLSTDNFVEGEKGREDDLGALKREINK
jgi:hypothetical protein